MATRGRKPKPTAMKELEGNPGKHPLNTSEPKPNKKAPACPKWLEPEAKKEWRRLAKQMEAIGIFFFAGKRCAPRDVYPTKSKKGKVAVIRAEGNWRCRNCSPDREGSGGKGKNAADSSCHGAGRRDAE